MSLSKQETRDERERERERERESERTDRGRTLRMVLRKKTLSTP